MGLTGCLFFSDIPNREHPHFAVIVFELDNRVLIIPISSIKFNENGKMSYDNRKCNNSKMRMFSIRNIRKKQTTC